MLIINLPLNSFAKDPDPKENAPNNNIANIINKVANEKITDTKNLQDTLTKSLEKATGQGSDSQGKSQEKAAEAGSISKIVSSLINKKSSGPSLMFSAEEIEKIEQAVIAHQNNQPFVTEDKPAEKQEVVTPGGEINSCVYLGSILYHSPNSWAAWINGQKITSSDNKVGNELYIKSIDEDKAAIVWTMSISKWKILADQKSEVGAPIAANNQVELNFNLSFNQTYMLIGGKIIEGRITPSSPAAATPGWNHSKALTDALKANETTKK